LLTQFKVLHAETTGAKSDDDDKLTHQAYLEQARKESVCADVEFDEDNDDEVSAHLSNVYATYWFVM
jgi:hypothetical protein